MNEYTWIRKYEPETLDGMILNSAVRMKLENIIRNPQNVILYGSTGVGKGTFTNIFIKTTCCNKLWKNASSETGIDMIRDNIEPFANAASLQTWFGPTNNSDQVVNDQYRHLKVVVFNEAENLSKLAQASLRELMERVEQRCKFIFMTNNIRKIDDAIQSRCLLVEIKNPPLSDIINHVENILNQECINFEAETLANIVHLHFPDIRKIIKEIQGNCNEDQLIMGETITTQKAINRVLLDLKLYMTYYGKEKKYIYDLIKDNLEAPVSQRQFYYLLDGNDLKKVSREKKLAVIRCIQEMIPVKDWLYEYMRTNE